MKQMSDAAGVLCNIKQNDASFKIQTKIKRLATMRSEMTKPHQRIWLKFHKCLSFRTPVVTKTKLSLHFMMLRPDLRSVPTPDMWVIHTRLVIGQGDERGFGGALVDQVQQNLLIVDHQVVHVL